MDEKEIRKHFEATTNQASWINSDIYPDGKIYTRTYTEWLESELKEKDEEIARLKGLIEWSLDR